MASTASTTRISALEKAIDPHRPVDLFGGSSVLKYRPVIQILPLEVVKSELIKMLGQNRPGKSVFTFPIYEHQPAVEICDSCHTGFGNQWKSRFESYSITVESFTQIKPGPVPGDDVLQVAAQLHDLFVDSQLTVNLKTDLESY
jgi:hypothetical protein